MKLSNKMNGDKEILLKIKKIFKTRTSQRSFFYQNGQAGFQDSGNLYIKIWFCITFELFLSPFASFPQLLAHFSCLIFHGIFKTS